MRPSYVYNWNPNTQAGGLLMKQGPEWLNIYCNQIKYLRKICRLCIQTYVCLFKTLFGQFPTIRFFSMSGSTRANFLILVIYLNSALVTTFNSNGATTPASAPTKPPFINRAFFFLTVPDFLLSVLSEFSYLDNFRFYEVFSGKFPLGMFFEHCDNVFTKDGSASAISCLSNFGLPWLTHTIYRRVF